MFLLWNLEFLPYKKVVVLNKLFLKQLPLYVVGGALGELAFTRTCSPFLQLYFYSLL